MKIYNLHGACILYLPPNLPTPACIPASVQC